ncbi:hypothetical protein CRYUN_Cryun35bG0031000 [Craigia yunnanensis]
MLRCRSPLLLALRMLSSSSFLTSNPKFHLPSTSQPISNLPLKIPFSDSCGFSQSQSMTPSNCFSATAADPIPISPSDQAQPHCQNPQEPDSLSLVVVSFYKFADFPDYAALRKPLKQLCQDLMEKVKMEAILENTEALKPKPKRNLTMLEVPTNFIDEIGRGLKIGMVNFEHEDYSEWEKHGEIIPVLFERVSELFRMETSVS